MDLVRELLLKIEEATDKPSWSSLAPQGNEPAIQCVIGRITLPDKAGLRGLKSIHGGSDTPDNLELTWKGHEFLNDARDPVIWGKTKERAKTVASVGLSFLWQIATAEIKTQLGLPCTSSFRSHRPHSRRSLFLPASGSTRL
jgi:hypothetical protein